MSCDAGFLEMLTQWVSGVLQSRAGGLRRQEKLILEVGAEEAEEEEEGELDEGLRLF